MRLNIDQCDSVNADMNKRLSKHRDYSKDDIVRTSIASYRKSSFKLSINVAAAISQCLFGVPHKLFDVQILPE